MDQLACRYVLRVSSCSGVTNVNVVTSAPNCQTWITSVGLYLVRIQCFWLILSFFSIPAGAVSRQIWLDTCCLKGQLITILHKAVSLHYSSLQNEPKLFSYQIVIYWQLFMLFMRIKKDNFTLRSTGLFKCFLDYLSPRYLLVILSRNKSGYADPVFHSQPACSPPYSTCLPSNLDTIS